MSQHPHQPQRFQVFNELKDGSGFTIKGTEFVFKFDKRGGWYDQYRNYYDSNGSPQDSPEEDNASDDDYSRSNHSNNEEDEFEKEFGGPGNYYEEQYEEDTSNYKFLEKIATNLQNLNQYPSKSMIRIHFRNISYYCKKDQIFNHFSSKVAGLVNVIFFQNENHQFNGTGYFVVDGIKSAEELIRLQGQRISDRQVNFTLQNVEDSLLNPITQQEKLVSFGDNSKKSYVNKNNTPPVINQYYNANVKKHVDVQETPRKAQQKAQKVQVKSERQPVEVKSATKQVKKQESLQQFAQYKFLKAAFPKKSSFKQWMLENNVPAQDYKDVQKIEQNKQFAKITMKKKIYKQLNNRFYNGNKIEFTSF